MIGNGTSKLPEILTKHETSILAEWVEQQSAGLRSGRIDRKELRDECRTFIDLVRRAVQDGGVLNSSMPSWSPAREFLKALSGSRARQGFSPSETATFVFSLKQPLFARLRGELGKDPEALVDEVWRTSQLLDELGLYTTEVYQKNREDIIARQQLEMLELSTPVVELWDGVVALPLIGTLDSARTQVVMETLLQRIVETGSSLAIIDITGVPTVDTLVAQHLLKTVAAARLMGADCIISGIRPQIAQTIVHLGVELGSVTTKATLADAFTLALQRLGASVVRSGASA